MSDIRVAEYELGQKVWYKISDDCVDTTEHDAKIRAEVIEECIKFVDGWDSVIADALAKNMKHQIE